MADSEQSSSGAAASATADGQGSDTATTGQDSVRASFAGWLGAGFVALGLAAFIGTIALTNSSTPQSLGFGAISGIALLSLTLVGLIMLTRAVGAMDNKQALGLPSGSVRALLALILAIVFVAVASWTLGGLTGSLGPLAFKGEVSLDDVASIKKEYSSDRYFVSEIAGPKTANITVYALRNTTDKDTMDLAKQIVTISATVLVTIVGFYFGSKSASDAMKSANESVTSMQSALAANANPAPSTDDAKATPAVADDVKALANAISAVATSTASKLNDASTPPIDAIRKAVESHDDDPELKARLATAEASLAVIKANARQCADSAEQAKTLATLPDNATQAQIDAAFAALQKLSDKATQWNHDLEQAATEFATATDYILKATAVG